MISFLLDGIIITCIALFIGILRYKFVKRNYLYVFVYVCISAFTELCLEILEVVGNKNNLPGLHFYLLIEYSLFAMLYFKQLEGYIKRNWMLPLSVIFIVISITYSAIFLGLFRFPNISRSIEALLLVVFSILFFSKVMSEAKIEKLSREPMIWFNTGVLIYFAGNFFFNVLFNIILESSRPFAKFTSDVYSSLNILFYTLIAVGFWKTGKKYR